MPFINQRTLGLVQILRAFVNQQNATLTARLLPLGKPDYLYPSGSRITIFFQMIIMIALVSFQAERDRGGVGEP